MTEGKLLQAKARIGNFLAVKAPGTPRRDRNPPFHNKALAHGIDRRHRHHSIDQPRQEAPRRQRQLRPLGKPPQPDPLISHTVQALCRRLQRVDGDAAKLLGQSLLHHIGQCQRRQPLGLKNVGQHPGQLKSSVAASEADQRFSRISVLLGTEQLAMEAVRFDAICYVCCPYSHFSHFFNGPCRWGGFLTGASAAAGTDLFRYL